MTALPSAEDALREALEAARDALMAEAVHMEQDCPGDVPEDCGWWCRLCKGHIDGDRKTGPSVDGHKPHCVISKINAALQSPRASDEVPGEAGGADQARTIEILRRALAWHGDPQRMATTREEWQQEIDAAIAWVKANPEEGRLSFPTWANLSAFADTPPPAAAGDREADGSLVPLGIGVFPRRPCQSAHEDIANPVPVDASGAGEPFGYWVEQKHAEPVLLRKPAYIPEPSPLRSVTPLYLSHTAPVAGEMGK